MRRFKKGDWVTVINSPKWNTPFSYIGRRGIIIQVNQRSNKTYVVKFGNPDIVTFFEVELQPITELTYETI